MHPYIFSLGITVSLFMPLALAAQSVPPQPIDPGYNEFEFRQERDLFRDLPDHQYNPPKVRLWPSGIVPDTCYQYPDDDNITLDRNNMEARDVYYNDCAAPWTICRYRDSLIEWDQAMEVLGRVPIGMRQHVAHVVLAPEGYSKRMPNAVAATWGTNTAFLSEMGLGVAVHEFNHILDVVIGSRQPSNQTQWLSASPEWFEFYESDTKVPTAYAAFAAAFSSVAPERLVEEFAETGRWAMSNMAPAQTHQNQASFRGGGGGERGGPLFRPRPRPTEANRLASYSSDWKACQNQIDGYRTLLEDVIFPPSGRCTGKTAASHPVVAATGQRVNTIYTWRPEGMMGAGKHGLRSVGVPEIVPADWVMKVRFPPYNASFLSSASERAGSAI